MAIAQLLALFKTLPIIISVNLYDSHLGIQLSWEDRSHFTEKETKTGSDLPKTTQLLSGPAGVGAQDFPRHHSAVSRSKRQEEGQRSRSHCFSIRLCVFS